MDGDARVDSRRRTARWAKKICAKDPDRLCDMQVSLIIINNGGAYLRVAEGEPYRIDHLGAASLGCISLDFFRFNCVSRLYYESLGAYNLCLTDFTGYAE